MDSSIVIKVKYGETLRRFTARVRENQLDIDMGQLREKVRGLFYFAPDAVSTFTYVDEDGDVVTLVDNEDLQDVMKQSLNPVRITVKLNTEMGVSSYASSSSSSTPILSSQVPHPLTNLEASMAEIIKSVPEPFHGTISKLASDLASKAAISAPGLTEFLDSLAKIGQSHLKPVVPSETAKEFGSCDVGASKTEDLSASNDDWEVHSDMKFGEPVSKINGNTDLKNETISVSASVGSVNHNIVVSDDPVLSKSISEKSVPSPLNANTVVGSVPVNPTPSATAVPGGIKIEKTDDCSLAGKSAVVGVSSSSFEDSRMHTNFNKSAEFYGGLSQQYSSDYWKSYLSSASVNCGKPKCSFIPMPNDSGAAPVQFKPRFYPFKRSYSHSDGTRGIFHRGVRCDGCGAHPIVGPRFKSKVKENYDLCNICFTQKGNATDYIRIDQPVHYEHPWSKGYLMQQNNNVLLPSKQQQAVLTSCMKPKGLKPDARFIRDVNIPDGTFMFPLTPFTKIWRMRNNGNVIWPHGAKLVWIGGDKLSDTVSANVEVALDGLPVDSELDIAVDFTAPELPGRYISYWRMSSPSGQKFGQRVWVLIQVDANLRNSLNGNLHGLNLNLPPEGNEMPGTGIINVTFESPMVDNNSLVEPENYNEASTEPVRPIIEQYPNKDLELNFPINDTLLVGNGVPTPFPSKASSSVTYPIIDVSEAAPPTAPAIAPNAVSNVTASELGVGETDDDVEVILLRELQEMGFKQVELNKEVLRLNRYNLEQSVDDLCGVAEWDPILEELQEMGFCDEELNKELLKKNNGSIKRVVMDLLAGK